MCIFSELVDDLCDAISGSNKKGNIECGSCTNKMKLVKATNNKITEEQFLRTRGWCKGKDIFGSGNYWLCPTCAAGYSLRERRKTVRY